MTVDLEKDGLAEIIHNFYLLTGIKIVFFDTEFKTIVSEPEYDTEFCAALKENKDFEKRCDECTKSACAYTKESKSLNIYRCHAGLTEAVIPIFIYDTLVGYIMLGQVIDDKKALSDKKKLIAYASGFTKNTDALFDKLVIKDEEHIRAAVQIMECCAYYVLTKHFVNINHGQLANQLGDYIKNNLTSQLTVDELCGKFFLSRNMLYKVFKKEFGMPIAVYIKKERIQMAKEAISNGMTITEAAAKSGFKDYNYFSKVFKKETGILPSKFKKSTHK